MDSSISEIISTVRNCAGVLRKQPIREIYHILRTTHEYGNPLPNYGDDAAAIPWGEGYLLLSADGMMTSLLVNEPYAAGKAAVMVTVNDIYSMGGRPLGMVNVLASGDGQQRRAIAEGIEKGCRKLRVPMLGGHLHPDSPAQNPALSVAILGYAKKLLRSHLAKPGDDLIAAVDLTGRAGCRSVVSWDANSGKSPEELLFRLEAMPSIAEAELAIAAKDVSNAGLLGTVSIMMENSGAGATIDLEDIPKPEALDLKTWILCFQSFGFILAVAAENSAKVLSLLSERKIQAARIGRVRAGSKVTVVRRGESGVLFDFDKDEITGIRFHPER